jgi:hypothetical protein
MFTAKINRKEPRGAAIEIFVDFTNGTDVYTESCIPQNADGFKYWVRSRLETFNSSEILDAELQPQADVDVSDTVVTPPVLTQAEIDRNTWLTKYAKWVRIKTTIVDTGIVPITNPQLVARVDDLKATLQPEYLDFI